MAGRAVGGKIVRQYIIVLRLEDQALGRGAGRAGRARGDRGARRAIAGRAGRSRAAQGDRGARRRHRCKAS